MMNPEKSTLSSWANSLVIDFPQDDIPLLDNESNWRKWGNVLIQGNVFSRNGAPGPGIYLDWLSWAKDVYYTMANF